MNSPQDFSRRQMLKTLGVGAALAALGNLHAENAAAPAPSSKAPPPQPFTLPALAYSYDALEPFIDARTMEIHHSKHHQAYIDQANRALADQAKWQKLTAPELLKSISEVPEQLRIPIRNQVGGHVNHSLFWRILSPKPKRTPGPELMRGIERSFGSFDAFKTRFVDTAMKRFGSGWAWLSLNAEGKLDIHSTANQDSPLLFNLTPVFGVDVWEHAYYLHYENRRLDYLDAFWNVADWAEAEALYSKALPKSA